MAWLTPKTDWKDTVQDGIYTGDYFNADDFNRIKNNLEELRKLVCELYGSLPLPDPGADRTPADYLYADEFNQLEEMLAALNRHSLDRDHGPHPVYYENGPTPAAQELNRLEAATLDLYRLLKNQRIGRRMFPITFGK